MSDDSLQYYQHQMTTNSNSILEVTNEMLFELPITSGQELFDLSANDQTPNPLLECINDTVASHNLITLDESTIHQLIDLELRNVPSTLGLVWSTLSTCANNSLNHDYDDVYNSFNSFQCNNIPSSPPSLSSPTITHSFSPTTSENQLTTSSMLDNSPPPPQHVHNICCVPQSTCKITKQYKMKSVPLPSNKQFCISFHQPEQSAVGGFASFTSYNIDDFNKKVSKKRKSSSDGMPNYRVRFSHNKFEEIEFKKSNPKGKFIIFK